MSTTLCQITANYLNPHNGTPTLIRALQLGLKRFLAVYVAHTPNLGWALAQVRVCNATPAGIAAWQALPGQQQQHLLNQAMASQTRLLCPQPQLHLTNAKPHNPARAVMVYLDGEWTFEFPGDFHFMR